ncbi:MAG: tail fiber domain-containing protein [Bacteroidota bacterium]
MKKHFLFLFLFALLTGIPTHAQTDNEVVGDDAAPGITTGDNNTIVGDFAGFLLTEGSRNVFLGYQAGRATVIRDGNIFIGMDAGFDNNTFRNTFIGHQAGRLNTTGNDNLFIGAEAGESNTQGSDNTFIGEEAGASNTTGSRNVFIGEDAGFDNTTASSNVFIGEEAGFNTTTGEGNTFIGGENAGISEPIYGDTYPVNAGGEVAAGYQNTTGNYNTYIGGGAGRDGSSASANTFIGYAAGLNNEISSESTFVGTFTGADNDRTGDLDDALRNNYFGFAAGNTNRDGSDNVGIGYEADFEEIGNGNSRNSRNVFIGNNTLINRANDAVLLGYGGTINNDADQSIGIGAQVMVSGQRSIGIGYDTDILAAADDAVGIGHQVEVGGQFAIALGAESVATAENSIAIGYQANVTTANSVVIGNSATTSIGGVVNWTATSDGRYKTDVLENVVGLDFINRLRPVTYQYNALQLHQRSFPHASNLQAALTAKSQIRYSGFLAQEVETATQSANYNFSGIDRPSDENGIYGLRYAEFVVPLVKAAQELIEAIEATEVEHNDLKAKTDKMDDLEARIKRLEVANGQANN